MKKIKLFLPVLGFMLLNSCGNPKQEDASDSIDSEQEVVEQIESTQSEPEKDIKIEVNTDKQSVDVETSKEDDKKLKLNLNTDKKNDWC